MARRWRDLDFRTDINGLRALAVIGVVAFHADRALLPGGFSGVDVFFVISGFLISRIILSECAVGHFSLAMFYAKRAKRILPALLVVAAAVWIVGWFRAAPTQFRDIGGGLLGNSYFTVNFWLLRLAGVGGYFGADSATKPLLHLWSLSIEEQFYLVWSVLVFGPAPAGPALSAVRHPRDFRRILRLLRHFDAGRSDRRLLSAVDPRLGTRARRAARLPGSVLASRLALSVARPGQPGRGTRRGADRRRLPLSQRSPALPRLARSHSDPGLRAGDRKPALLGRRCRARQSRRPVLRRRFPIRSISGTGRYSPSPTSGPASFRRRP